MCHVFCSSFEFGYVISDKQKRSSSFIQGRTKSVKERSRGATFIRWCLTTSTLSSTDILQPANGGIRQRSTFAYCDFFSQFRVLFTADWHTSFPPIARSLDANRNRYSSLQDFSAIKLCFEFLLQVERQIKMPFIRLLAKDEERNIQLSWYHLHSPVPRDTNLVEYWHTPAWLRRHPAKVYFRMLRFLLAAPGFIHSALTYELFTNRSLSWRNRQLLLVPSKLLLYSIVNIVVNV